MPNQGVMRASRGAAAGALAATVWAAQMPLDKRAVGSSFDDVELLGKLLTRGRHWRKLGWAVHIQNGALFGAGYALVSPHIPLPSWARGPAIATAENMATWPLTALSDNVHPARGIYRRRSWTPERSLCPRGAICSLASSWERSSGA